MCCLKIAEGDWGTRIWVSNGIVVSEIVGGGDVFVWYRMKSVKLCTGRIFVISSRFRPSEQIGDMRASAKLPGRLQSFLTQQPACNQSLDSI